MNNWDGHYLRRKPREQEAFKRLVAAIRADPSCSKAMRDMVIDCETARDGLDSAAVTRFCELSGDWFKSHNEANALRDMTEKEIKEKALYVVKQFQNERDVAVFNLNHLGLSQHQIADKLNCSVGTVNATIKRLTDAGFACLKHKGGGAHTGDTYRKNHTRMDRTHRDL